MDKRIKIVYPGDNNHDYDWALAYTEEERLDIASKLLEEAWEFSHNQTFPKLDRNVVKVVRLCKGL